MIEIVSIILIGVGSIIATYDLVFRDKSPKPKRKRKPKFYSSQDLEWTRNALAKQHEAFLQLEAEHKAITNRWRNETDALLDREKQANDALLRLRQENAQLRQELAMYREADRLRSVASGRLIFASPDDIRREMDKAIYNGDWQQAHDIFNKHKVDSDE